MLILEELPSLKQPPLDSDRDEVTKLIYEGKSDAVIADLFNVAKVTIWERRREWGLPSGSEIKETLLVSNIKTLWQEAFTTKEISETLKISTRIIYARMKEHNIRAIPRMGLALPNMSFTQIKNALIDKELKEDTTVMVTYNSTPKWALVPIEEYQDLVTGVYEKLHTKQEANE